VIEFLFDIFKEYGSQDAIIWKDQLDSLGLVNMIVLVEEKTQDKFGKSVTIADERAMSQKNSPFRTVRSLSEYLFTLLSKEGND